MCLLIRTFFFLSLLVAFSSCAPVREGEGAVHVFYPLHPQAEEIEAAKELARVLGTMTGRRVHVGKEPYFYARDGFYVGDTLEGRGQLPELLAYPAVSDKHRNLPYFDPRPTRAFAPVSPDRWDRVGWASRGGRISIAGTDAAASKLAVSLFLQKECGVRWWIPGPWGEEIPSKDLPEFSEPLKFLATPSFSSRAMAGLQGREGREWAFHNMLRGHVSMSHALPRILNSEVASSHPDWFPRFEGKSFDPDQWKGPIPHPVFTNAEVMDYVAARTEAFFDANPNMLSFSISPGDTSLFGDQWINAKLVNERASFRLRADLSNLVFSFYNGVAERVTMSYPDCYLGALAYSFYENVPSFPVERNIIPFLTADRSQWYDKGFREEDLALVRRWAKAGPEFIGTWDYYYGCPFLIPRVMIRQVCDSIPMLKQAGVAMFFAELYPRWGYDAPKAWLATQLLWDSQKNAEELKKEFFSGYFGPVEAPMREFFELCDAVWMSQEGKARWIRYYGDADQMLLFSDADLAHLRSLLNKALAVNIPERFRRRVELVSVELRNTERVRAAWKAWNRIACWTSDRPVAELEAAIPDYIVTRKDMAALNEEFAAEKSINSSMTLGYLEDDEPLAGRFALLRSELDAGERRHLASLAPDYAPELLTNSIWLCRKPFERDFAHWNVTHWPNPLLKYSLVGDKAERALLVSGANIYCARVVYAARPSARYACAFQVEGYVSASSTVRLLMEFTDDESRVLSFHADRLPIGRLDSALLAVAGEAPQGTSRVRVSIIVGQQAEGDQVAFRGVHANSH